MRKLFFRIIFCLGLLLKLSVTQAQPTDSATVDPYESVEEDSVNYFNAVSFSDQAPVQQRRISNEALQKLRKDKAFWYVNKVPEKPKVEKEKNSWIANLLMQSWFRILVWTLIIGGFVGAIVWFLIASDVRLFRRKAEVLTGDAKEIATEDIYTINYDAEISKAIASQNFRLALRLMYLQTLKSLSEKEWIQYKQERTNSDYLMQLYGKPFYPLFFQLTRHFEYAWYGQFAVSPTAFERIRDNFEQLKTAVR